ncbi:MAG: dehydrogenase [Planctomycetes bacterium RBG_16_64_10]|nr:MAG: dehydrogenase [Planctomycetes bacterium RBG_16_64_10]
MNRRRFLAGAVTSVAAPYVITSTALGNASTPPASERVTIGHIGVGNRGRGLLSGFMRCPDAQCVAVADAYQDRRDQCARIIGGTAYGDFRALLARDDIDAVVIATPDHWHVPMAVMAARAGKDAYVEKPLGISIEQDLVCRRVFAQAQRIFQYGTQQRSMAHCRFGCELVRSGRIGQVRRIEVTAPDGGEGGSTNEIAVPPNLDYPMWLGPAPEARFTASRCDPPGTYWIYDYSIGYLAGWGAHPLDIMVWGSDADLAGPITVQGTGEIPDRGLYNTVWHWQIDATFGEGVAMTFKPGEDSTRFIGPDGWVDVRRSGIDAHPKSLLDVQLGPDDVTLPQSPNHQEDFVRAVKTRQPAISTLDHAVRSDIISQLGDIAVRTGRKISWDPVQEMIVGDPEAARMLTRPMRPPWTL